ncbi:MAG: Ig-like domain-containing protein, partial [Kiritimatiellia bacterium]
VWNWTLTRADPVNATVRAEYVAYALNPRVVDVRRTLDSPVPITTNLVATLVFDRTMDPAVVPEVTYSNLAGTVTRTLPLAGGIWQRVSTAADSYRCPPASFARGEDGIYVLSVAAARDPFGSVMTPTNAWIFTVDATPPALPVLRVTASNETSCTVGWQEYAAPEDLNGFRVYVSTVAFTNLADVSPRTFISAGARAYTVSAMALDTNYWVAVVPTDRAGNMETAVAPIVLRLPRAVPPPVTLTVTAPGADTALLNWAGYAGNSFGFAGFRVYSATAPFASIEGMTPIATLGKAVRTYTTSGLDRTLTHWFAVVGYNLRDEVIPEVTARAWTDPYQGEITQNLTLGTPGGATEILGTLTVRSGATLTIPAGATLAFRQGTGIVVENGALVANGTALAPIRFTAANPEGRVLQAGDWSGITLAAGAGASLLRHVWIEYGSGLTVEGCAPVIDACSAQYNAPAALRARAGATLRTADALLLYNAVALFVEADATMEVSRSIVRNNQTNALATAGALVTATNVWWGAADLATVQSNHVGNVVCEPLLTAEPVLTPAADAHDGNRTVGVASITLALAARVAEAVQISEDSLFTGSFFDPFTTPKSVALSAGGGLKTLYIRFRNAAGQVSDTVTLPVTYITGGPQITACNIAEGAILTRPFLLTATASSGLGVASLRALVDETVVAETNAASLNARWDVRTLAPGTHRVRLEALDTRGNLGTRSFNVTVNIQPPPNPVLTAPQDGLLTTDAAIAASGTAEPFATVTLRRNGAVVHQVSAAQNGAFSATVTLVEGENIIAAWVTDEFGSGRSNERRVMRDSGAPAPVTLGTPGYKQGTGLQFDWLFAPEGEQPASIALLRAAAPFAATNGATWQGAWTTANPLVHTPPSDGRWYFAAIGRDAAHNVSQISNLITNDFDGTPPVFTNAFDKPSPCGTGPLQIEIESSEPLSGLPIITVQPPAASGPTMLTVSNTAPNRYTSVYNVQAVAGSGPLAVKVTGTDFAGNRATGVTPAGPVMVLDTRAPAGLLTTVPAGLIQVTNPVLMQISLMLDETPSGTPLLRFVPPEGATLPITLTGGGTNWAGTIELLPSMGSGIAGFTLTVSDTLGNAGTQLDGAAQAELYNTALPEPPPSVTDLRASTDQKGGVIKLAWLAVPDAESYSLYRQAGAAGTMPDTLIAGGITAATYEDLPPEDGFFRYAVCSVRRGSMAAPSPIALGISDRTPPPTPQNLTASLSSSGVRVEWEYSTSGEQPARFRVYRNGTLLRDRLSASTRYILDNPAKGTWTYTVSAADINLNEALSNEASIDLTLPGVVRTDVIVGTDRIPRITWQTRAEHVGVNLYRNNVKLNATPLTGTSFTDSGLSGSALTRYEVRGVNSEGTESAARQLPVYHAGFALNVNSEAGGHALLRYFDQCVVTVSNLTGDATLDVSQLELTRAVTGGSSMTRTVASAQSAVPGGNVQLAVTYPCATEAGQQTYSGVLLQALDDTSASVRYELAFTGGTPSLAQVQIEITVEQQPVAGAACVPQARFYNRSQVPIDLVMWRNGQPGDVAIRVLDVNETEVNRVDVMMPKASLIATPDGQRGFVRIPANSSTLMVLPEIIVPEALGEQAQATIEVVAAFVYTACGTAGEELSGPLQARLSITPRPTPYTAFGLPEQLAYRAGETLVITGYAFERATGMPMTNAPVSAGIGLDGFAWYVDAVSDSNGCFRAEWPIVPGISGLCQIWAAHPDVRDRLNHGQTAIYQAYFRPAEGTVRMAANDILTLRLNAYNPGSFTFTNLTAAFTAWQITEGVTNLLPMSVVSGIVENVEGLGLPPKQLVPVTLKLFATEEALPAFNCRYELVTPEGLRIPFDARVSVTAPLPLITVAAPANGYVDMSLDRGKTRSSDVELRNDGFKALLGVKMTAPTVPWMQVALTPQQDGTFALPDLAPGQSFTFQVLYAPGDDVEMKYYSDSLAITGTNSVTTKSLNLYAKVTSELRGSLAFHVANSLGQVVPDASVRVRSALDGTERTGFKTDANGDVVLNDLMEGRWHWQVSASGHATQAGTAQVEADLVTSVEPILTRELVTVTFTVVPVPFTDRYEIKIEQTFSTYVPAPVLVVDPVYRDFGKVTGPFEHTFTATAKNYGLIKMTEFTVRGSQTATASMTPAISYLPVLAPMEQIEIPYTVSYWGDQGAPVAPQTMTAPVMAPLAAPRNAASLARGAGTLSDAPQYNPCTDDFMEAVEKLMSHLNGMYGSMSGSSLEQAKAAINLLWEVADSDKV